MAGKMEYRNKGKVCKIENCDRSAYCKEMCTGHYQRSLANYDMPKKIYWKRESVAKPCKFPKCTAMGMNHTLDESYCAAHLGQKKDGKELRPRRQDWSKVCLISHCERLTVKRYGSELCSSHRSRAVNFNLTPAELNRVLSPNKCHACGYTGPTLGIDHDHACCPESGISCGKCVRALLCADCNRAIGMLNDDTSRMRVLIKLIEDNRR